MVGCGRAEHRHDEARGPQGVGSRGGGHPVERETAPRSYPPCAPTAPHVWCFHSQHPDVVEAAVFGLPDAVYGERVVAVITGSGDVRVEEVLEWMAHHIPPYKVEWKDWCYITKYLPPSYNEKLSPLRCCAVSAQVPSVIRVLDSIPKNAMGKVRFLWVCYYITSNGKSEMWAWHMMTTTMIFFFFSFPHFSFLKYVFEDDWKM